MYHLVNSKSTTCTKCFITNITIIRLFSSMYSKMYGIDKEKYWEVKKPFMIFQCRFHSEGFSTFKTFKRFFMCVMSPDVDIQVELLFKYLGTALMRTLPVSSNIFWIHMTYRVLIQFCRGLKTSLRKRSKVNYFKYHLKLFGTFRAKKWVFSRMICNMPI